MDLRNARYQIIDAMNKTGLPLDILEYVVKDILSEIHEEVMRQYTQIDAENALKAKEESEKKSKGKSKKDGEPNES